MKKREDIAEFATIRARRVVECVDVVAQPQALESGWWAVVGEADGRIRAWRFAEIESRLPADRVAAREHENRESGAHSWVGPARNEWSSSLTAKQYVAGVEEIQGLIARGELDQCNLTRVIRAPLPARRSELGPSTPEVDARALYRRLAAHHGSPHAGFIQVEARPSERIDPMWLVSASPELFLRRENEHIASRPIKGTAPTGQSFLEKDDLESKFIADQVASQFASLCELRQVSVSDPVVEEHPGLLHLVREVSGRLRPEVSWAEIFAALFPPASVSGFPQEAAKPVVSRLEKGERGPYCGIFGWVDGDNRRAELAVTIRSFWWRDEFLHFGTGAGITAGSDPVTEWDETELKAVRLLDLVSERES